MLIQTFEYFIKFLPFPLPKSSATYCKFALDQSKHFLMSYILLYIHKTHFYVFSSRSRSKGKLVSNGHNSPTKKEKSLSCSPKNNETLIEEKTINSKSS